MTRLHDHFLLHKMILHINVFYMLMIFIILSISDCSCIIAKDTYWCLLWYADFLHKFSQPEYLLSSSCKCYVLCFNGQESNGLFVRLANSKARIKPTAPLSVFDKENSIEFLLDFLYYLYKCLTLTLY